MKSIKVCKYSWSRSLLQVSVLRTNGPPVLAITAAGVVSCGGPKKSPRTSSIVQVIFSFRSFSISKDILRNQKQY